MTDRDLRDQWERETKRQRDTETERERERETEREREREREREATSHWEVLGLEQVLDSGGNCGLNFYRWS